MLATLLAAIAGQAMAAGDSIDVKVTGQFVPPACVPTVAGGAVFDYGSIKAATLAVDNYTVLSAKKLDFNIVCDSPMKVAFKAVDQRKSSVVKTVGVSVLGRTINNDSDILFGLGVDGTRNVGAFAMNIVSMYTDEVRASPLVSQDSGNSWTTDDHMWLYSADNKLSAPSVDNTTPVAFTTLKGQISLQAALNKGSELDLTKITNLDGLTSIQMVYL